MGTPKCLSPDSLGQAATPRSDLCSVGSCCTEMLAGAAVAGRPRCGGVAHLQQPVPSLRAMTRPSLVAVVPRSRRSGRPIPGRGCVRALVEPWARRPCRRSIHRPDVVLPRRSFGAVARSRSSPNEQRCTRCDRRRSRGRRAAAGARVALLSGDGATGTAPPSIPRPFLLRLPSSTVPSRQRRPRRFRLRRRHRDDRPERSVLIALLRATRGVPAEGPLWRCSRRQAAQAKGAGNSVQSAAKAIKDIDSGFVTELDASIGAQANSSSINPGRRP